MTSETPSPLRRAKEFFIGAARSPRDRSIYQKISLVAFFAWVGLGADGLSSSCYGPAASWKALLDQGGHSHLAIFVALATAATIFVISRSYSQLVEVFPGGGGGYLVASKLLTPHLGLLAGCALMVDYVLTISLSIAAGADAMFSSLPPEWQHYKLWVSIGAVLVLTLLNLRGARESVGPLVPIFLVFVVTHIVLIAVAIAGHAGQAGAVVTATATDAHLAYSQLGMLGMLGAIGFAYSMGAGTYTGIEAVSNGMPTLREPRVHTAKRAMTYIWISLAITVVGLIVSYLLCDVHYSDVKTMNAVLLDTVTSNWPGFWGQGFVWVTLASEAAILFIAAQTGFLGGPRVLANLALDRWFPVKFSTLSDRLVTHYGILMMSVAALVTLLGANLAAHHAAATEAPGAKAPTLVDFLLVLYSINVFITFVLSQAGMVRHWWQVRQTTADWRHRITINGVGLVLCAVILVWVTIEKFSVGGWVTLLVTGGLFVAALWIRHRYTQSSRMAASLDKLAQSIVVSSRELAMKSGPEPIQAPAFDPNSKTAVLLVSGFTGLGLHSLLNIIRYFGTTFRNFVFVGVGVIDAGNFKGIDEVDRLQKHTDTEVARYVKLMHQQGYFAVGFTTVGTDVVDQISEVSDRVLNEYPSSVFFAGQLLFPQDSFLSRMMHNNIAFAAQRHLYLRGVPFVVLPFQVKKSDLDEKKNAVGKVNAPAAEDQAPLT
jgi:amino acid transporter